jgi:hypothetical protein
LDGASFEGLFLENPNKAMTYQYYLPPVSSESYRGSTGSEKIQQGLPRTGGGHDGRFSFSRKN